MGQDRGMGLSHVGSKGAPVQGPPCSLSGIPWFRITRSPGIAGSPYVFRRERIEPAS
jgi:hypothetical protein